MKTILFALAIASASMLFGVDPALAAAGAHAGGFDFAQAVGAVAFAGLIGAPAWRVSMSDRERAAGRYLRDAAGHDPASGRGRELAPEQIADELRKNIDQKHKEVLEKADAALTEAQKSGALSQETKDSVDKLLTGLNVLREQLAEIEQKMARRPGTGDEGETFGKQFAASEKFKSFQSGGYQGSVRFAFDGRKATTAAQAGTAWTARDNDVASLPRRRLTVRNLLDVVPTTSGSIDYARQSVRTNNAAPVAEGAAKPYSVYEWEQISTPVRVIAHLAKITRQAMDDAVQLEGEIESEMRFGLAITEEDELLNGDGTGQHLDGLIANATAYAAPAGAPAADQELDQLRIAMLQIELAFYMVDGVILNPIDWVRIETLKDTTGRYIIGDPQGVIGPRLWGRPVVSTPVIAVDKFLLGAFKEQRLYDRMQPEVLIASENVDDFEKNLFTMRCEERVALAVRKPVGLVYGDFGNVA